MEILACSSDIHPIPASTGPSDANLSWRARYGAGIPAIAAGLVALLTVGGLGGPRLGLRWLAGVGTNRRRSSACPRLPDYSNLCGGRTQLGGDGRRRLRDLHLDARSQVEIQRPVHRRRRTLRRLVPIRPVLLTGRPPRPDRSGRSHPLDSQRRLAVKPAGHPDLRRRLLRHLLPERHDVLRHGCEHQRRGDSHLKVNGPGFATVAAAIENLKLIATSGMLPAIDIDCPTTTDPAGVG